MSNEVGAGLRPRRRAGRGSTAPRWSSSTRGAWPSARRAISSERLGKEAVAAHHGSLAKETAARRRAAPEARRAEGAGRDRFARTRHRHRRRRPGLPARLAALDRDASCSASGARATRSAACRRRGSSRCRATSWSNARRCSTAVRRGELDALRIAAAPLDVLAQQIVAEARAASGARTSCSRWCAAPRRTRALTRESFDDVVRMLAEGFTTRARPARRLRASRRGQRHAARPPRRAHDGADLGRRDPRHRRLRRSCSSRRPRRSARVNEDFAVESLAGDVFQLGNTQYRILRVEPGRVRVEDAQGAPPNIPFWLGEAPGRSDELSSAVSRLRDGGGATRVDARAARDAAAARAGRRRDRPRRRRGAPDRRLPRRARAPRSARCRRSARSSSSASSTSRAACSS